MDIERLSYNEAKKRLSVINNYAQKVKENVTPEYNNAIKTLTKAIE